MDFSGIIYEVPSSPQYNRRHYLGSSIIVNSIFSEEKVAVTSKERLTEIKI